MALRRSASAKRFVRASLRALALLSSAAAASCGHDWDGYDPRLAAGAGVGGQGGVGGASAMSSGSGATASSSGPGASAGGGGAGAGGSATGGGGAAGKLYVIGGENPQGQLVADVFVGTIAVDGQVSNWTHAGTLAKPRHYHAGVATQSQLYIFGGETTTFVNDSLEATPAGDGSVGLWLTGPAFQTARFRHATVRSGLKVYLIGGYNGAPLADVQWTTIASDGSLAAWTATQSLPVPRHRHAAASYSGFVYVLGGSSSSTIAYMNNVTMAQVQSSGALGAWTELTPFVTARFGAAGVAVNSHVYVLGGLSDTGLWLSDVQVATMNVTDGSLGGWTMTQGFSGGRYAHAAALFNNRIYVVGGKPVTSGASADVQFATIQADGTLTSWQTTASLPEGRAFMVAEAM